MAESGVIFMTKPISDLPIEHKMEVPSGLMPCQQQTHQRQKKPGVHGKISPLGLLVKSASTKILESLPASERGVRSRPFEHLVKRNLRSQAQDIVHTAGAEELTNKTKWSFRVLQVQKTEERSSEGAAEAHNPPRSRPLTDEDGHEDDDASSIILGDEILHVIDASERPEEDANQAPQLLHAADISPHNGSTSDISSCAASFVTAQTSSRSSGSSLTWATDLQNSQVDDSVNRGVILHRHCENLDQQWKRISADPHNNVVTFEAVVNTYVGKGKEPADRVRALGEIHGKNKLENAASISPNEKTQQWLRTSQRLSPTDPDDQIAQSLEREDFDAARRLQEELEAQDREAERLARLRDCVVCGDTKDVLSFPASGPALRCNHEVQTCYECLATWIASELEAKGCEGIKCPECPELLGYDDIARAASAKVFSQYDDICTRNVLSQLDEFAWCLKQGCGSGQLNVENGNYMKCKACNYEQCLNHRIAWHLNETCEQHDRRVSGQEKRDQEQKSEKWIEKETKQCPNTACGWRIQKADGCDHMKCRRCKHEFCWLCMASMEEIRRQSNTAHQPSCKYHSDRLAVAWPFNVH